MSLETYYSKILRFALKPGFYNQVPRCEALRTLWHHRARASAPRCPRPSGINARNLLPHSSGGYKSKESAGLVSSEASSFCLQTFLRLFTASCLRP